MEDHSEERKYDAAETIRAFFDSFGKMDLYAQIVMEEFMEALLEEKK